MHPPLRLPPGLSIIYVLLLPAAGHSIQWPQLSLGPAITGFSQPTYIANAGDGSGRLFVVEQGGTIRIVKSGVVQGTAFLDIHSRISCCGERGLLSMAFPPTDKGHFYVYYTNSAGDLVIARYFVTANPDVADPNSEVIVLTIPHPVNANHNGGQLAFGPDGYLYAGTGDGGSGGDPPNNAQNTDTLLGKILRIDVESATTTPYAIPASNPYAQTSGYRPEIWAFGVRNPWRFSFDRQTHDLYIGDVGQGLYEEIDYQPASTAGGENYGWRIMEGLHCYNAATCNMSGLTLPVSEYSHAQGNCSVTGGFVYRAVQFPRMQGIYFYGDYCTGWIWGLQQSGGTWANMLLYDAPFRITTFGEDEGGNVYAADTTNGSIAMLTDPSTPTPTLTATTTPMATQTSTNPPAAPPTPTSTATRSRTPSATSTASPTATLTPTRTASAIPTNSVPPTPTWTTTGSPTVTPTSTPTRSPTRTPTVTITPTTTNTPPPPATPTATKPPLCVRLAPNGPATVQTQNLPVGCSENWQCVQSNDGDPSYVYSPSTLGIGPRSDLYAFDDLAPRSEPIVSVNVRIVSRSLAGAVSSVTAQLRPAGVGSIYDGTPLSTTTAYTEAVTYYPTNPANGLPWSWPDINSLHAGLRAQVAGGDEVRTTQVAVEVCWAPGPGAGPYGITGQILYAGSGLPVNGATVELTGPTADTTQTNSAGQFAFVGLPGTTWRIEPRKLQPTSNAISAADAVAVLQAVVGTRQLDAAQQLACDVSGDGRLSASDALLILNYNVGTISSYPAADRCASNWIFVPQSQDDTNRSITLPSFAGGTCQLGSIEWSPLTGQVINQNFIAALIGECSGNWTPTRP